MIGSLELFDLRSSRLVYSTGRGVLSHEIPLAESRDWIVVRRRERDFTPRSRICAFSLAEFFRWQFDDQALFESFSELSRAESEFLSFGFCPSLGETE
jgi:hypothetical protein